MESYLSKIISSIPASQRESLRKILNEEIGAGEVLDLEKLIAEANRLGLTVDGSNPRPLLASQPRTRVFTSRQLNQFIRFSRQDLLTVFNEIDNISFVTEALDRLNINDSKKIDKQIRALENELTVQEILLDEPLSLYLESAYSSFSSSSDYSSNVLKERPGLYRDPRSGKNFLGNETLAISVDKEGLTLPVELNNALNIFSVNISEGFNSDVSDFALAKQNSFILSSTPENNLDSIRRKDSKLWCNLIYLAENTQRTSPPVSVVTELIFNLGGPVDLNNIKLSPLAGLPLNIQSISYLSLDNTLRVITDSDFTVNDDISFSFDRITAQKIYIKFSQTNYFHYQGVVRELEYSDIYGALPANVLTLEENVDIYGLSNISAMPNIEEHSLNGWIFPICLDLVQFNLSKFKERGIFLSKEMSVNVPAGKVLLDSTYQLTTNAGGDPLDSIEYYVNKYDYSVSGGLVSSWTYPILPVSDSSVVHESLVLNNAGITGLRFYPDTGVSIRIYKNFAELTIGSGFDISVDGATYDDTLAPSVIPSGPPYKYFIRISDRDPLSSYTASYTPLTEELSSKNPLYMDNVSVGVLQADNSINFIYPSSLRDRVDNSKMILTIILRSLDFNQGFRNSPIIFDYTLHVG